ncbi:MAG: Trm112 family protein [Aquificaceae bacterium]
MLSEELLSILACPICKGPLEYLPLKKRLVCHYCKVYYPFIDDIPVLIPEHAVPLESLPEGSQT